MVHYDDVSKGACVKTGKLKWLSLHMWSYNQICFMESFILVFSLYLGTTAEDLIKKKSESSMISEKRQL